jgi:hypothetical protein
MNNERKDLARKGEEGYLQCGKQEIHLLCNED